MPLLDAHGLFSHLHFHQEHPLFPVRLKSFLCQNSTPAAIFSGDEASIDWVAEQGGDSYWNR